MRRASLCGRCRRISGTDVIQGELYGVNVAPSTSYRYRIDSCDDDVDIAPHTVIREPMVALTMLIAGAGIARLPDYLTVDALANGTLVRVLPDLDGDTVEAHAVYPSHRSLSAKVIVFVDMLAAYLAKR